MNLTEVHVEFLQFNRMWASDFIFIFGFGSSRQGFSVLEFIL